LNLQQKERSWYSGFVTKQTEPKGTMTKKESKAKKVKIEGCLREDEDLLRGLMKMALQEVLEAEMNEALGAGKSERNAGRLGYRSGYYALASETDDEWLDGACYMNMEALREQSKTQMPLAA
jgi:Transposase, Mutator family